MKPLTPGRFFIKLVPFIGLFVLALLVCPLIGPVKVDFGKAFAELRSGVLGTDGAILFVTRMPRTLLAALAGAGLAMAGAALQALLRNPLADPFTLGVASGGALGAVLGIELGLVVHFAGFSSLPLFAFAGALGAVEIVYLLARRRKTLPSSVLLLSGVTLSFFFSAIILAVHYFADFTASHRMIRWMMGGLDVVGYKPLLTILPVWLFGVLVLIAKSRTLNLLTFGDYLASTKGVNVPKTQQQIYFSASLITGAVVALAGPIGFVGLIVPHSLRLIIGPDYRVLMPASLFAGAAFLLVCDTVARTILAPAELPVGILTAFIGGPFFLALLFKRKI